MQWVVAGTAAVFLHPVWVGVAGAEPAEQGASAGSGASLSRRHFLWLLLSAHSLLQRLASQLLAPLKPWRSEVCFHSNETGVRGRRLEALVGISELVR